MKIDRILEKTADGYEGLKKDPHDNKLYRYRYQDTAKYYQENQAKRNVLDKSAVNRHWSMPVANIPYADYQNLVKKNPELASPDAEIRTKAWLKVLKFSENERLRTVRKNLIPDSLNPDKGSII